MELSNYLNYQIRTSKSFNWNKDERRFYFEEEYINLVNGAFQLDSDKMSRARVIFFKDGRIHRNNGPAVVYLYNDGVSYYYNGQGFTKQRWFEQLTPDEKYIALWDFNVSNWRLNG